MKLARTRSVSRIFAPAIVLLACTADDRELPTKGEAPSNARVFIGATLIDGNGGEPIDDAVLVVREGRVEAVGPADTVKAPQDAERVDLSGRTVIPGIINAHGHVGVAQGHKSGAEYYTRANILEQLRVYARYGVTTVVSLGEPGADLGVGMRDEQDDPTLDRARLFVAGPVLEPDTPEEAREDVARLAEMQVDWAKIRVDDYLGEAEKMSPETYTAVIEAAHEHDLPVTAHMVELKDAKRLVQAGADVLAHSVRDAPVDDELIELMRSRDVCLQPTLSRELSTFIYAERPEFFDDPFFLREADPAVIRELERPQRQREYRNEEAKYHRDALPLAKRNMMALHEAGVRIAFGTDSGPPARFQGYFEHLEMTMMADAGMEPADILFTATGQAADCMRLDDVGRLEPGKRADFVVLSRNPLEDIRNTRSIDSVWIAGNRVPDAQVGR